MVKERWQIMTGRIFLRGKIWWMAYYLRGKEYRESTKTIDRKLAEKFLKRRRHEVGADQEGIQQFVGPQQQRISVNQLLDKLELNYRSREKWNPRVAATFIPLRKA